MQSLRPPQRKGQAFDAVLSGMLPCRARSGASGNEMDKPEAAIAPMPAATILLIRDPLEVLMVRRRKSSFFSSALVFPGGVVDPHDGDEAWLPHLRGGEGLSVEQRALRIAACREAHEEASVLITEGGARVVESATTFRELVAAMGAKLPLDALVPFAHWITPVPAKKRFDTHFYICRAPDNLAPRHDGDETVSVEWVDPAAAVARAEAGEQSIIFPTLMQLVRLAESKDVAAALVAALARPAFTVTPTVEKRGEEHVILIPAEAGYGVTEFAAPDIVRH